MQIDDRKSRITEGDLTENIWSAVADVDVEAWDRIRSPSDVFMDLRLLQAVEASMAESSRFRYVLYRDASGEPVASAVVCTFNVDIGVLADDAWSRAALDRLRRISRWLAEFRILFCGLPLSTCQSSLRFAPGADTAAVLKLLDRTLRRLARQDGARAIVLKEFTDSELPPLKPLEDLGYRLADSMPTHVVRLGSDTFDGYLMDLPSRRRTRIRHSLKKFAASGIRFITTSDVATIEHLFTPEVYQMYERVLGRSKSQFEHLPLDFFLEMARRLPDTYEITFAVDGDRVRGFANSLWYGHNFQGLFVGYDESINEDVDLYFNLFFRGITDAARHHATHVEIGQNSAFFKRTKLGALQSRRSIYVRGGNRFMNWLLGLFFKQLFPARPLEGEAADE